ncbi:ADP-ribosylglycohydrolase family protein [Nocardioides nanhaiensis]|uniref:ADP-ribosylglycohydrolase family protein n=1 Tax=Nocardioides nanhaiensis TaxID=1476871 RepID=A0ABP8W768_9ACTN
MSATTQEMLDRAVGVLLGQAIGDALGVPYEFATPPGPGEHAQMLGGGLGDFAPGEWSDDTAMAVGVAEGLLAARRGGGSVDDEVAARFLAWYDDGPADIGNQTAAVLGATRRALAGPDVGAGPGAVMRREAQAFALEHPHSAGNGALMRTGVVALAHLEDRATLAQSARAIAGLTHADPLAGDSCVLWCESVRRAVREAVLLPAAGLDLLPEDRRAPWAQWLREAVDPVRAAAEPVPGRTFTPNGFTVTALQAAWAAIATTQEEGGEQGPAEGLHAAVRIGDDTDTVAAIAGTLLGARWGAAAWPTPWRESVHGWPGRRADDLEAVARGLAES